MEERRYRTVGTVTITLVVFAMWGAVMTKITEEEETEDMECVVMVTVRRVVTPKFGITTMQFDMKRRGRLLHEQRRKDQIEMAKRMEGVEDKKMPMYTLSQDTVTLCMEISHADHIEIIMDRNGLSDEDSESFPKIFVETETLIQFPDREDNGHDLLPSQQQARAAQAKENSQFVNQVTITGPSHIVNEARIRLRSLCSLTVCFPVVNTRPELPVSTLTDWLIRSKENGTLPFHKLKIQVLPPYVSYIYKPVLNTGTLQDGQAAGPAIRVTGRMCDEDEVLRACETLRDILFDPSVASEIVFSSHVYIPSSHWKVVVGDPEGSLMKNSKKEAIVKIVKKQQGEGDEVSITPDIT